MFSVLKSKHEGTAVLALSIDCVMREINKLSAKALSEELKISKILAAIALSEELETFKILAAIALSVDEMYVSPVLFEETKNVSAKTLSRFNRFFGLYCVI